MQPTRPGRKVWQKEKRKKAIEIARAAKAMGLGIEQISQLTNLSAMEIKSL